MPKITREQLKALLQKGMSYADIGRVYGISREMTRRYANAYGVKPVCSICKQDVDSARERYCAKCRAEVRSAQAKKCQRLKLKTFANRPVVLEAYRFFAGLGLDVVLNAESNRNEPEVFVNGHGVKCSAIVPVSKGHQCRLVPNEKAEWLYLSDGGVVFVIPAGEIVEKKTYIGEKSELQQYRVDDELGQHDLAGVLA